MQMVYKFQQKLYYFFLVTEVAVSFNMLYSVHTQFDSNSIHVYKHYKQYINKNFSTC